MATPEQQREYQRNWLKNRRQAWLDANGPCVDCGSDEKLEVDHVDSNTKVTHNVWSWSQARRDAELAKCVVRCESCHLAKTVGENSVRSRGTERSAVARLDATKVREIRAKYAAGGTTYRRLGAEYGIHRTTAWDIVNNVTWAYLEEGP